MRRAKRPSPDSILGFSPALVPLVALAPLLIPAPALPGPAARTEAEPPETADSVVVVVSTENPVTEIRRLRLADIYMGRASHFPDGPPVVPIDQAPGSPDREAFYGTYLGRSPAEIKAHWSKLVFTGRGRPPRDVPSGKEVKELVAENPRAIGYVHVGLVDESIRIVRVR